jgi:hypothetical protein
MRSLSLLLLVSTANADIAQKIEAALDGAKVRLASMAFRGPVSLNS